MDTQLSTDLFLEVDQALIFVSQYGNRRLKRALKDGAVVSIGRGAFVPTEFLTRLDEYNRGRAIHIARALFALRSNPAALLAGPTVLLCHGIGQLYEHRLPVHLALPRGKKYQASTFRPVPLRTGECFERIPLKRTILECDRWQTSEMLGSRSLSVVDSAVQCLRLLPEEQGFVSFVMAGQVIARTDRRDSQGSEERLAVVRNTCQRVVDALPPGARGRRRLRQGIAGLSFTVESVLEARLLWLLCSQNIEGFTTQSSIPHHAGTYYPDFLFPDERLIIEVDGQGKYGTSVEERTHSLWQQNVRQQYLESQGFRVMRFGWHDLNQPQYVLRHINEALAVGRFFGQRRSA